MLAGLGVPFCSRCAGGGRGGERKKGERKGGKKGRGRGTVVHRRIIFFVRLESKEERGEKKGFRGRSLRKPEACRRSRSLVEGGERGKKGERGRGPQVEKKKEEGGGRILADAIVTRVRGGAEGREKGRKRDGRKGKLEPFLFSPLWNVDRGGRREKGEIGGKKKRREGKNRSSWRGRFFLSPSMDWWSWEKEGKEERKKRRNIPQEERGGRRAGAPMASSASPPFTTCCASASAARLTKRRNPRRKGLRASPISFV